jgi:predicted pyridoxine 5'-phosphate oxidase superfamily flavin-nucleotide-binding protein
MLSLTSEAKLLTGARLKMRTRYAVRVAAVFTLVSRMRWQFFA